jgi:hypothetical protein
MPAEATTHPPRLFNIGDRVRFGRGGPYTIAAYYWDAGYFGMCNYGEVHRGAWRYAFKGDKSKACPVQHIITKVRRRQRSVKAAQ